MEVGVAVGVGDRTTRVLVGGRVAEGVMAVSVVVWVGRWVAVAAAVAVDVAAGVVGVDDGVVVEEPVTGTIGVVD